MLKILYSCPHKYVSNGIWILNGSFVEKCSNNIKKLSSTEK